MKENTATVQGPVVREFMHIIVAQAKAALGDLERPGCLQLSRLHPLSEQLVPSRFMLTDVELMIEAAVTDCQAGHNVYLEGRTVHEDLRGNVRGTLADSTAVFALVIDSDADKQMSWTPTARASMTVETSPGNFQFWFFLREAIAPELAQKLGERIRKAVNSDHDTGNPTQPYRVAGTVNYPNKQKIERGRVTVPTRLVEFDPETLWTPEDIETAFPLIERAARAEAPGGETGEVPADTMKAISEGVSGSNRDRSYVFFNVVLALKRLAWTTDAITALLEQHPNGIAAKYTGRLRQEVERVYSKIKDDAGSAVGAKKSVVISCAEDLRTMTFKPIKYVVPGIFVEGLTVLAGKPKIGKSWLFVHAAIAVARGGFTFGDLHCIEGDVFYCALEDNERRMQSRMTKLLGASHPWPKRLSLCYDLPRLGEGGAEVIRDWIVSHPEARMVAIDTLAMIRALKKTDESNYQSDYLALLDLRALANEFGIALVVSHHLRKAEADDPFDTISGTLGLTGAVDSMLVLKRDSYGGFVLHGKGRDLIEVEKAMSFDRNSCLWRIEGDAGPIRRSSERTSILNAITEAGQPIGPTDIATATGMKAGNVRFLLLKLMQEGVIEKAEYGKYRPRVVTV
jgi:AAA domain/RepB DNA-primase from phage plasmid/IclR helix-turn-helix domain